MTLPGANYGFVRGNVLLIEIVKEFGILGKHSIRHLLEFNTVTAGFGTINHPFPFSSLALRPRRAFFRRLILSSFVK